MATDPSQRERAFSEAFHWVGRVLAVVIEMALPGILGSWLGQKWGIPLLGPLGFGVGLFLGVSHLLLLVSKSSPSGRQGKGTNRQENGTGRQVKGEETRDDQHSPSKPGRP